MLVPPLRDRDLRLLPISGTSGRYNYDKRFAISLRDSLILRQAAVLFVYLLPAHP
jgi:hypothetical protein